MVTFLIDCSTSVARDEQAKNMLWRYLPDFWFSLAKMLSPQLSPDLYFSVILFPSAEEVLTPTRVSDLAKLPDIQERESLSNEYDNALKKAAEVGERFAKEVGGGSAKRVVVLLSDGTWERGGRDDKDSIGDQLRLLGKSSTTVYLVISEGPAERQWWERRVDRMWPLENIVQWLPELTEELLAPFPRQRERTPTGERFIGWISGTTTLDTVLPGDFVSVTARVIALGPITGPMSFRTTPHGYDYPLDRDREWPWDNSYSRVSDDLHGGNCYPYKGFTIVNRCTDCPDYYALGFYQLEFARPEFRLLPSIDPHESINGKEITITLTLEGLAELYGPQWRECYTATLSVPGSVRGSGMFHSEPGKPLTTNFVWQPPEPCPRFYTGTIELWAVKASEPVSSSVVNLKVKYRPELLTVSGPKTVKVGIPATDEYSIAVKFAPASAKPDVYLITTKEPSQIKDVNSNENLQTERGELDDIDLQCPLPTPQPDTGSRYRLPLKEGNKGLKTDRVATWWRDADYYVVRLFKFVPDPRHCGYDRILFHWKASAEIVETTWVCSLQTGKCNEE